MRAISDHEVSVVARIWHRGWHDAHASIVPKELTAQRTLASFEERLKRAKPFTNVCFTEAGIAGFTIIKENEIDQFYVAPTDRGKGVAQLLMLDAETRISDAGFEKAWLACSIGNDRAARFYEKSGWENVGSKTMMFEATDGPFPLDVWIFETALT